MKNIIEKWIAFTPYIQSIFRIVVAFMFLISGSMKLFAYPVGIPPHGDIAPLMSEAWIAGIIEFMGGALLLIGLYTRPVAFIASGEMAVAYFQFHFPQNILPHLNNGIPAVLYCFIWLYFSSAGGGAWSMDAILQKPHAEASPHPAFNTYRKAS